jgi:hypothetical protein
VELVDDGKPKLAGIHEIAELRGVSRQRAGQIAAKADFPEPIDRIAAGPVWWLADVEAWHEEH